MKMTANRAILRCLWHSWANQWWSFLSLDLRIEYCEAIHFCFILSMKTRIVSFGHFKLKYCRTYLPGDKNWLSWDDNILPSIRAKKHECETSKWVTQESTSKNSLRVNQSMPRDSGISAHNERTISSAANYMKLFDRRIGGILYWIPFSTKDK